MCTRPSTSTLSERGQKTEKTRDRPTEKIRKAQSSDLSPSKNNLNPENGLVFDFLLKPRGLQKSSWLSQLLPPAPPRAPARPLRVAFGPGEKRPGPDHLTELTEWAGCHTVAIRLPYGCQRIRPAETAWRSKQSIDMGSGNLSGS